MSPMRKPLATADATTERRRYVILRHELPLPPTSSCERLSPAGGDSTARGSHYDVMFETDEGLLTWAVERLPSVGQPRQPALRLPLHRTAYLDYEGPVSGDRGYVHRVQAGTYCQLDEQNAWDEQSPVTERSASAHRQATPPRPTPQHYAFVCQGLDREGRAVAQLVLLDRVVDGGWELRSITTPPKYPTSSSEAR